MTEEELATAAWRKAKASGGTGGDCVEVAPLGGGRVGVRHSRHPEGPALIFTKSEWDAFKDGMSKGEFDF
ncbi:MULTISPECIES: DUF397 domain-containing protein [unclassified Nonomuraea]|uniref:DUF397 domain-containing protein n=1 Tax=unclassified Nonomuraea TaxID=2593643 RepID=UPI00273B0FD2|nr:DUF397 domain-containing protein [Nonomuraea sp. G32]MDP4511956.1 DUF397 domain-containing protein [Nonomuraea sp. G32]